MSQARQPSAAFGAALCNSPRAFAAWRNVICACALVFAAALQACAQQLSLKQYGRLEGLQNLNVNCLLTDREGFLWACTENGLYRYDGVRFQRFGESEGLDNTLVYAAVEDDQGRIWIATSSDLYVGFEGRFTAMRPHGRRLAMAAESSLVALPGGVAVIVRNEFLAISLPPHEAGARASAMATVTPAPWQATTHLAQLSGLQVAPDGHLWFGCDGGICEADGRRLRRRSVADGVPDDHWVSFLVDARGDVWARGRKFVLRLQKGSELFAREPVPNAVLRASTEVAPIAESADGSVIVRVEKGLARWWHGKWSLWTTANGLPSTDMTVLMFDREGSLWIAAIGKGVSRWIGYDRVESWTQEQGLESDVVWKLMRRRDGLLMVATSSACSALEPAARRLRPCKLPGIPPGEIASMAEDASGNLWIGFRAGNLWVLDSRSRRARLVGKLPHFTSMFIDSKQRLWLPTRGGIFLKLPSDLAPQRVGNEHEFVDAAEDAQGGVWFAGSEGLVRFSEGVWTHAPLTDRRADPGFASVAIGDDGVLWAASRSRGVLHAELSSGLLRNPQWVEEPTVANAAPMFVRIDSAKRVWVGTDYGAVVRDASGSPISQHEVWNRLTENDGLVWNDVDQGSFLADADGSVWIGTSGGLSHIVDPVRALSWIPLQLKLMNAKYASEPVDLVSSRKWKWRPSSSLDLDLVSLNFSRSIASAFRYRIVGVDADWFETNDAHVHYQALEPGSYRLEAMLVDPDRRQSSAVVGFDFELVPPWWRSLWFRAFVVALGSAALLVAWRWQVGRIMARHAIEQKMEKERTLLLERASRDALTGLWNRASILDLLQQSIMRRSVDEPLALAVIDVDHFKRVNDEHGHAAGDEVLRELSRRLSANLRQVDLLGRYGGEELLLVLPGLPCHVPVAAVERLREAVCEHPFVVGSARLSVTVSIGVAWLDSSASSAHAGDPAVDAQRLFERADAALYDAKHHGRNRVVCAPEERTGLPADSATAGE